MAWKQATRGSKEFWPRQVHKTCPGRWSLLTPALEHEALAPVRQRLHPQQKTTGPDLWRKFGPSRCISPVFLPPNFSKSRLPTGPGAASWRASFRSAALTPTYPTSSTFCIQSTFSPSTSCVQPHLKRSLLAGGSIGLDDMLQVVTVLCAWRMASLMVSITKRAISIQSSPDLGILFNDRAIGHDFVASRYCLNPLQVIEEPGSLSRAAFF